MGVRQRVTRLQDAIHGKGDRQRAVSVEVFAEILPFEPLHDHEGGAALHPPDVVHLDDVLPADARSDFPFPQEALDDHR